MYCMQDKTEVGENMRQEFETRLFHTIDKEKIYVNEKMEKHTTFRIGGPADYFVMPSDVTDVKAVIELCEQEKVPYYVVGNGSNLLVGDKGFRGVIIQIAGNMNQLQADGEVITAQAGCSLAQIAGKALDEELAGFEFAAGIPGTTSKCLEFNILNDTIIINIKINSHNIATFCISYCSYSAGVFNFSHISWMLKMIHYFF